jgi:hypothetical protein
VRQDEREKVLSDDPPSNYMYLLETAVKKARADEREACAKLCEKAAYWDGFVATNCAERIRSRGEK